MARGGAQTDEFRLERERRPATRTTCARLAAEHDARSRRSTAAAPPHATVLFAPDFVRRLKRLAAQHEHAPTRAAPALAKNISAECRVMSDERKIVSL